MFFGKRWVPLEVMDTIFLLWAIGTVMIIGLIVWLRRKAARPTAQKKHQSNGQRNKRQHRKK